MKWVQLSRRDDLRDKSAEYFHAICRLCAKHFEDGQFYNAAAKTRLLPYAVPTLFDVPNPPRLLHSSRRILGKRAAFPAAVQKAKRQRTKPGNGFKCLSA
jgi:hypothetical protein